MRSLPLSLEARILSFSEVLLLISETSSVRRLGSDDLSAEADRGHGRRTVGGTGSDRDRATLALVKLI